MIHALYAEADGISILSEEGSELLTNMAPTLIGGMVRDLNARETSRGAGAGARLVPCSPLTIDRDAARAAPCACHSGRAYARCCGANE